MSVTRHAPERSNGAADVQLLTVRAAAERLGLARSTLYQLMESGRLAYYRFGRARRIDPADLERLKESCRVGPEPHRPSCATPQTNVR